MAKYWHNPSQGRTASVACGCSLAIWLVLCLVATSQQWAPGSALAEAKSVHLLANLEDARLFQRSASYKWHVKRQEPEAPASPVVTQDAAEAEFDSTQPTEEAAAEELPSAAGPSLEDKPESSQAEPEQASGTGPQLETGQVSAAAAEPDEDAIDHFEQPPIEQSGARELTGPVEAVAGGESEADRDIRLKGLKLMSGALKTPLDAAGAVADLAKAPMDAVGAVADLTKAPLDAMANMTQAPLEVAGAMANLTQAALAPAVQGVQQLLPGSAQSSGPVVPTRDTSVAPASPPSQLTAGSNSPVPQVSAIEQKVEQAKEAKEKSEEGVVEQAVKGATAGLSALTRDQQSLPQPGPLLTSQVAASAIPAPPQVPPPPAQVSQTPPQQQIPSERKQEPELASTPVPPTHEAPKQQLQMQVAEEPPKPVPGAEEEFHSEVEESPHVPDEIEHADEMAQPPAQQQQQQAQIEQPAPAAPPVAITEAAAALPAAVESALPAPAAPPVVEATEQADKKAHKEAKVEQEVPPSVTEQVMPALPPEQPAAAEQAPAPVKPVEPPVPLTGPSVSNNEIASKVAPVVAAVGSKLAAEQWHKAHPDPQPEPTAATPDSSGGGGEELVAPEMSYKLDVATCSGVGQSEEVLNKTIEAILGALTSQNCSGLTGPGNLRLRPLVNKQLAGFVLESSSLPLDASQFTFAQMTHASCLLPDASSFFNGSTSSSTTAHKPAHKFTLKLEQEFADSYLSSRWRLYPRLRQDDLPDEVFKSLAALKSHNHLHHYDQRTSRANGGVGGGAANGKSQAGSGNKCQRFSVESGDFYLELLALRTSSVFEVELDPAAGGRLVSVSLADFYVNQLYLDHGLMRLQDSGDEWAAGPLAVTRRPPLRQQTRQILHANNNHFRRNNWLLDLYGNWMKHEYRGQLRHLFNGGPLRERLNACFPGIHQPAGVAASQSPGAQSVTPSNSLPKSSPPPSHNDDADDANFAPMAAAAAAA